MRGIKPTLRQPKRAKVPDPMLVRRGGVAMTIANCSGRVAEVSWGAQTTLRRYRLRTLKSQLLMVEMALALVRVARGLISAGYNLRR